MGGFGAALLAALVVTAIATLLEVIAGTTTTTCTRCGSRSGSRADGRAGRTDVPGIVYLEIDGLAMPVLQRAMRDGNAPEMARWVAEGTHRLVEWETDLSSQTGASQAGILLGSNEDIPAFRWVEKERGVTDGLLGPRRLRRDRARGTRPATACSRDGGASRGNLLSGDADHVLLTVSRVSAEKRANPGYRPFFANGNNVTRALVLFIWEVLLERVAALRASAGTCGRAGIAAASTRSCARRVRVRARRDRLHA